MPQTFSVVKPERYAANDSRARTVRGSWKLLDAGEPDVVDSTDKVCAANDISTTARMYFPELAMFSKFHSQTLFSFGTKSYCKCSSTNKTVLLDFIVFTCFSASSAPYPSFIYSLIFSNERVSQCLQRCKRLQFASTPWLNRFPFPVSSL